MKALLLALMLPFGAFAQESTMPFKGANVIILHTPDSAHVALVKFARALQAEGVSVDRLDKELLSITTKPTGLTRSYYAAEANYLVTATPGGQSVLTIRGQCSSTLLNIKTSFEAQVKGDERGVPYAAFRTMQAPALAYPNGKVTYLRKD